MMQAMGGMVSEEVTISLSFVMTLHPYLNILFL